METETRSGNNLSTSHHYDIFNGDADGICALLQLRSVFPVSSELITGVKRDIELLGRVQAAQNAKVVVLDISLDKNRTDLVRLLGLGAEIFYVDHHFAGQIPASSSLTTLIDCSSGICTSMLINNHLNGREVAWAVVGACGDNLAVQAAELATSAGISHDNFAALARLGRLINYNSYGATEADLHIAPERLFRLLLDYSGPLQFLNSGDEITRTLEDGYNADFTQAEMLQPAYQDNCAIAYILPAAAWARRISGEFANRLVTGSPDCAHAILTTLPQGGYLVSIRAPLNNRTAADQLARKFPDGGGRAAAAGINCLAQEQLDDFMAAFASHWQN